MADVGAVVAAAGQGRRMNAGRNKLFLLLRGKPVLIHTLEALEQSALIGEIVVAAAPGEEEQCWEFIDFYGLKKIRTVVAGGATRQESVARALSWLGKGYDFVAVHDGARPFVSQDLLARTITAARSTGSAVPGVPVRDTVKLWDGEGRIDRTLPRERLVAVQTPQVFARALLEEAYARALRAGFQATDDASLVEWLGYPVAVVAGEYSNLKLTTREDLDVAELYLARNCGASKAFDDGSAIQKGNCC